MMTSQTDKDTRFWDKAAPKYAASAIADLAGFERSIARVKDYLSPQSQVLELGCGTGTLALALATTGASITATDISPQMIEIAKEKAKNQGVSNVDFQVARADQSTFDGQNFDVALAFNLLHLVEDTAVTLQRLHASLKPEGLMISKTPNLGAMNPLIRWVFVPVLQAVGKAPSVHSYAIGDVEQAIEQAGFDIIATESHASKGKDIRPFLVARKR